MVQESRKFRVLGIQRPVGGGTLVRHKLEYRFL